ncbi:SsrA-binding protein [Helicobacter pylori]|uniref:SsrA-binding protein n=1 Tax=Helicobacter pylori TaxID=210 RepID=UPI001FD637CC|nr:SsrA-binding protein [Helicobacter pylori]UOR73960.1 SsrA-binding protein [Helicobacter pylori]
MKHPNAKAIGLSDVGGEFGSCSLMDFTEFELQRIRSIISYKGVTLRTSLH